ncbi:MAG: hypothetical protein IKD76_07835 [Clostridia bacterium]|nr:hypothetical protein [Clostridia bacterium]
MFTEKSNFVPNDLDYTKEVAKRATNPATLDALAKENYANEIICMYIADNSYVGEETLEVLAKHPSEAVRITVAERSYKIKSSKTLAKLCYDTVRVREALAKRTTDDGVLTLLMRGNPSNKQIMENCLSRLKNVERIDKFILTSEKEELLKYVDALLENPHLRSEELLLIVTESAKLREKQVDKIMKHKKRNLAVLEELLRKAKDDRSFII